MSRYWKARSIHIFAWPFWFNEKTDFSKLVEKKGWKRKNLDCRRVENDKEYFKDIFQTRQYLSESAKNIFLDEKNKVCTVLEYPFEEVENYKYCIELPEGKKYELDIESIELHIYSYGVGIMFFRTLNMEKTSTVEDIKRINDFGRRIALPFIPDEKDGTILCAESIGIVADHVRCITSFRERIESFYDEGVCINSEELLKTADFLECTLNCNLDQSGQNDIDVKPTTDDRMFLYAMIRDNDLSEEITKKELSEEKLYSIIFVDSNDATCQSEDMRKELMKKACYTRWEDYGTLYAVTNYSFICITTKDSGVDSAVVKPFYVEYPYVMSLVLAQKTTIMQFSVMVEVLAEEMRKKKCGLIGKKKANKLIDIQEKYISYKNRMMILEISCQEQGIELYRLMQKQLQIETEKNILDEQLQGLYDVVNINNETRANRYAFILSIIAIVISVIAPILKICKYLILGIVETILSFV